MKNKIIENIFSNNNSDVNISNGKLDLTEAMLNQFPDKLKLDDPEENTSGFTQYLKDLLNQFDNDM